MEDEADEHRAEGNDMTGFSEKGTPEQRTERELFQAANLARRSRLAAQSREPYGDTYRRKKVHWWTIETALLSVIELSGLVDEFEIYYNCHPVSPEL